MRVFDDWPRRTAVDTDEVWFAGRYHGDWPAWMWAAVGAITVASLVIAVAVHRSGTRSSTGSGRARGRGAQMEEMLAGGNMNVVVRVGDTVRRQAGPWTPTVHRLLTHLHDRGVPGLPEPRGVDDTGREALTFLHGTVPMYPLPAWVWADQVLTDAARLLRTWHDASIGFDETDAVWQSPRHEPVEVIGHNDFSPHNMVFDDERRLVGVIDVDMSSPGCRVWDLSYLATRLVPLTAGGGDGTSDVDELRRRLALLADAYGAFDGDLLRTAHTRLLDLAELSDRKAGELAKPHLRDDADHYRSEAAWLQSTLIERDAP